MYCISTKWFAFWSQSLFSARRTGAYCEPAMCFHRLEEQMLSEWTGSLHKLPVISSVLFRDKSETETVEDLAESHLACISNQTQ